MEEDMKNTRLWEGTLKSELFERIYVDMTSTDEGIMKAKCNEIYKRVAELFSAVLSEPPVDIVREQLSNSKVTLRCFHYLFFSRINRLSDVQ
jgi:hypothetical protein